MSNIAKFPCEITPKPDCLRDKIILVTGAGDGIGRVAALSFAEYGATVILLGKTESKLESVYDEIETKKYPQPSLCTFDLNTNDPASYKALAAVIEKDFGRLDGLLHNAAILGARNSIESYKPKQWMEVMQVLSDELLHPASCDGKKVRLLPCLNAYLSRDYSRARERCFDFPY